MYYVWQVNRTPYTHFIDKSLIHSKQPIIKLYPITHLVISTQGPALAIITLCLGTHRQSNIQHTLSVYCYLMGFHLYNLLVGQEGIAPTRTTKVSVLQTDVPALTHYRPKYSILFKVNREP